MSEKKAEIPPHSSAPVILHNTVFFDCEIIGDSRRFQAICKDIREEFETLGPLLVRQRVLQMELAEINEKIEQVRG